MRKTDQILRGNMVGNQRISESSSQNTYVRVITLLYFLFGVPLVPEDAV